MKRHFVFTLVFFMLNLLGMPATTNALLVHPKVDFMVEYHNSNVVTIHVSQALTEKGIQHVMVRNGRPLFEEQLTPSALQQLAMIRGLSDIFFKKYEIGLVKHD